MSRPPPTIDTPRLRLAPLTVADADDMVEIYADERMYEFTGGAPLAAAQLRERYEVLARGWNHDRTERWCNWIVRPRTGGAPVGAMQATVSGDLGRAAVAWEVGVDHQGHGYASEAAQALVEHLLASGVRRIVASIHPDHAASATVAIRAGLAPTAEIDDGEVVWQRYRDIT